MLRAVKIRLLPTPDQEILFRKSEGFDDYLSKPIELEKLEAMLMTYLPKEKIKLEDV